jgi:SHS2 domain-containing protein
VGYEALDMSGDAGLRVWGGSLEEAFESAALGMYGLITDIAKIERKKSIRVSVKGNSLDGLLVAFLNELVFRFDAYGFVGKAISIEKIENNMISAVIEGEEFEQGRHEAGLLIKAATYHNLKVEKHNDRWEFDIIFDI